MCKPHLKAKQEENKRIPQMELLSNQPRYDTVPEKYIFPPEKRPVNNVVNHSINLPVIDLRGGCIDSDIGRDEIIRDIMKAGKEFGFFQVINHGIPAKTLNDMLQVCENFFKMPAEEKERYYSDDMSKAFFLNSSTQYDQSETRYWRDYMRISCYPIEEFIDQWPEKPENFRAVLSEYTVRVREIASKLLKLIAEGLGLDRDYFCGDLSNGTKMKVNYYPPCPDPSLTMGLLPHCDRQLITILAQGTAACGLQAKYKEGWIDVKPIPDAFVVNFGHQLEIVTNGILKSVEHRAITNSTVARTSIATMTVPTMDCLIAPAKKLVTENNPHKYKEFIFRNFIKAYDVALANREGVLEFFKLY